MPDDYEIHTGDSLTILKTMADQSIHCVVSSPPYARLRDYGTASWEGGNDPECDHLQHPGAATGHMTRRLLI